MKSILLRTLATTGVIATALVAPHMLQLIKRFDRAAARRKALYSNIRITLWRLERAGLIQSTGAPGQRSVELTVKGRELTETFFTDFYQIPEPTFWDGKWRVLVFDMREKRRKARDTLRTMLRNAGFIRLQDSVWVYPYPCDEFVELVRAHLKSGTGELQYFVAEALESDKQFRSNFGLT